jgi:hypothetical protein
VVDIDRRYVEVSNSSANSSGISRILKDVRLFVGSTTFQAGNSLRNKGLSRDKLPVYVSF